ncbi:hypothetical protein SHIRM173S_02822 [Streptomyces hirsutus]
MPDQGFEARRRTEPRSRRSAASCGESMNDGKSPKASPSGSRNSRPSRTGTGTSSWSARRRRVAPPVHGPGGTATHRRCRSGFRSGFRSGGHTEGRRLRTRPARRVLGRGRGRLRTAPAPERRGDGSRRARGGRRTRGSRRPSRGRHGHAVRHGPPSLPSPPGSQGSPSPVATGSSETGPNSPGRCTTPIPTAPRRTVSRDPGRPHPRFSIRRQSPRRTRRFPPRQHPRRRNTAARHGRARRARGARPT